MKEETKKRGVLEKIAGSGEWWIQYFDSQHRRRREKVGSRSKAEKLVEKRRTQAREGVKIPESFRAKPVTFAKLAERALAYSKANKRSYSHDKLRMKLLTGDFGNRLAEEITRADIRLWLESTSEEWTPATRNCYLSDAEEERLRAVIQKSFPERLAEFEVGLMTGMRQGEQFTRSGTTLTWMLARSDCHKPRTGNAASYSSTHVLGGGRDASHSKHRFRTGVFESSAALVYRGSREG